MSPEPRRDPAKRYGFAAERIADGKEKSHLVVRQRHEPKSLIGGLSLGVECVDDYGINSDLPRKVEQSRQGIAKEISAQASATGVLVDSEAREERVAQRVVEAFRPGLRAGSPP